jgi:hypothetical protein
MEPGKLPGHSSLNKEKKNQMTETKYPFLLVNTNIGDWERLGLVISRHTSEEALESAHRRLGLRSRHAASCFNVLEGTSAPDVGDWILKENEGVKFRRIASYYEAPIVEDPDAKVYKVHKINAAEYTGSITADGTNWEIYVPLYRPRQRYVLAGDGDGSITVYGPGRGDALRAGAGNGDAVRIGEGEGNARRVGEGEGAAIRGDDGVGHARREGEGAGNAFREGEGAGDAVREDEGDGDAIRLGEGAGDARRMGEGAGDARRMGAGDGDAIRRGGGDGDAVRMGAGNGYVMRGASARARALRSDENERRTQNNTANGRAF